MNYLSLCDGIGAAHVAWQPLGWTCLAVAEIDKYCNKIVEHRWGFPNLGDVTKITSERILKYGTPDVVIGGTPCQAFSVAGKQAGMADPRGRLTRTFFDLVGAARPAWVVWENVPGVLSIDGGRVFGAVLATLEKLGYGWAYRTLDAQYAGVPQRRDRVFLVGHLGDAAGAGAVLFEPESLPGNFETREGEEQNDYRTVANRPGTQGRFDYRLDIDNIAYTLCGSPIPIAEPGKRTGRSTKNPSHGMGVGKPGDPMYTLQAGSQHGVAYTLRRRGDSGMRVGIDNILVAPTVTSKWAKGSGGPSGDECQNLVVAPTLLSSDGGPSNGYVPLIAFDCKQANDFRNDVSPTLRAMNHANSRANGGGMVAVCDPEDLDVRRLTPRECERLQGFPDDYTLVPLRTTKAGRLVMMSDTQRYKMIGNSMAVPVIEQLGRRIARVDAREKSKTEVNMPKKATKKRSGISVLEIPITQRTFDELMEEEP